MRVLPLVGLLVACNDQNFSGVRLDTLAVTLGDFDDMSELLDGLDVASTPYEGFIVQAVYEPEGDRTQRGSMALSVETLLDNVDDKGRLEINLYSAVFLNSGTRGLGAFQYNNALEADDSIVADAERVDAVCNFVTAGGVLVVSDWAYDVVEACWPSAIEFVNEDTTVDGAQTGRAGTVTAVVKDETAKEALGAETIALSYDYSAWAVMEGVGNDTEVLVEGSIEYQPSADLGYQGLADVPLLVRFTEGQGSVVFGNFHWATQNTTVGRTLLKAAVPGLSDLVGGSEGDEE